MATRSITWRADAELAQEIEDALAAINRHLPPKDRLSFQQLITARMLEYLPELKALAAGATAKEDNR